jgi:hypothetical protein
MNSFGKISLTISCSFSLLLALQGSAFCEQYNLDHNIMRDTVAAKKDDSTGTLKKFSESYKGRKSPKMAIFFNRSLSDDVREWQVGNRTVVAGEGALTASSETLLHYREESIKGPITVYNEQYNGVKEARDNASESYVWAFEDGFIQPFLRAGANLVDRGTIMRLISQKADQGFKNELIETKKAEMTALLDYADIYIELLVTRYPSAPTGYEFKAMAKEVKTGRIVGSATSLNWDAEKDRPKKVITTDKGYKVIDDPKMPKVQNVARDLAVDLMNSLMSGWTPL